MAEILFTTTGKDREHDGDRFRRVARQEYYGGDLWIDDIATIEVRSERRQVGSVSLIRQRSSTSWSFTRTSDHIREDPADISILWFVKHGSLELSNTAGTGVVQPGGFVITRSTQPFSIKCRADEEGVHEVFHVTAPADRVLAHIPLAMITGFFIAADLPELTIAENVLTDVFESDDGLAAESAIRLVDTALTLIGSTVKCAPDQEQCGSLRDRRRQEVLRYIDVHLANPRLCTGMAARGLDISSRYLSTLLKATGTPFSSLMWRRRLERAKLILSDPRSAEIPVAHVAYELGFKSAAHFSRMFRRHYQMSPRECRLLSMSQ